MVIWVADAGGTNIRLGLMRKNELCAVEVIPAMANLGLCDAVKRIAARWTHLHQQLSSRHTPVTAVGLALPVIVNPQSGRIYATPKAKYDDAPARNVGRLLAGAGIGNPYWCNDAHAALAGEYRFGAARGVKNVIMVTLGTGIGSAVMINGHPLTGVHGLAGNIAGHSTIDVFGTRCECGNIGCAELCASTWGLESLAKKMDGFRNSALAAEGVIDYRVVFQHADHGDSLAIKLVENSVRVWGAVICNLVHQYDPELVLIGGGIAQQHRRLLPAFRAFIQKHSWTRWRIKIRKAALGNNAGLLGVGALAVEKRK